MGHKAEFSIEQRVIVKDSRPVNGSKILFKKQLKLNQKEYILELRPDQVQAYSYNGKKIEVEIHCILKVDDGWIIDSKVSQEQHLAIEARMAGDGNPANLVEPTDDFDFITNLKLLRWRLHPIIYLPKNLFHQFMVLTFPARLSVGLTRSSRRSKSSSQ